MPTPADMHRLVAMADGMLLPDGSRSRIQLWARSRGGRTLRWVVAVLHGDGPAATMTYRTRREAMRLVGRYRFGV
jgi:hypothetical protein